MQLAQFSGRSSGEPERALKILRVVVLIRALRGGDLDEVVREDAGAGVGRPKAVQAETGRPESAAKGWPELE